MRVQNGGKKKKGEGQETDEESGDPGDERQMEIGNPDKKTVGGCNRQGAERGTKKILDYGQSIDASRSFLILAFPLE